jgi:uncharacterized protein YjdB
MLVPRRVIPGLFLIVTSPLAAQNVAEVQVAPPSVTIKVGERTGLLATAFDRVGNVIPTVRFIWSSNNVQVARVDNNGTVTGVAGGVAIIEARVGTRRGTAAVQVTGAPAPAGPAPAAPAQPPAGGAAAPAPAPGATDPLAGQPAGSGPAAALRIDPPAIYLLPSENTRVSPRALRADGGPAAPIPVTWTSLTPQIASVDAHGTVVALSPGQGTLQATAAGGLTATAPVVVQQADIAISETGPLLLAPGATDTLRAVVPSQNRREISPLALSWTSSDTTVARVTLTGLLTAVGPGKATVSVSGLLQSRSIEVTVHKAVEILVARPRPQNEVMLPLTATARFQAEALAADNTPIPEAPLRWELSDTAVASFDPATGAVTGKAIGRTVLMVRAPGPGLVVTWTINVIAGAVRVTPARAGLVPGRRVTLAAEFVDDRGTALGPARVQWTTQDPAVATVGADGAVTATGPGRTRVTATAPGGKTVAAELFVLGDVVVAKSEGTRFGLYFAQRDDIADLRRIGTDTTSALDPTFSPDGSRIAFVSTRDGNPELYLMEADGSAPFRLTNDPGVDGGPAFGNERAVFFHSDRVGKRLQVFMMSDSGQSVRQLTTDSTNSHPAVSPDGRTVAFVSTRDRNYDVWLMSPDGSNQRQFTRSPQWNERYPQFLRDGTLAYLVERREGNRTVTQVMRAELATGQVTSLSGTDLLINDFAVSPAGDLLALVVPAPGQERRRTPLYRVVIVPVGGGAGTPVEVPAGEREQMLTPAFIP